MESQKHWTSRNRSVDVFDVKADIVSLLGAQKYTVDTTNAPVWAHPYVYGKIVQGKKVFLLFCFSYYPPKIKGEAARLRPYCYAIVFTSER